MGYRKGAVVSVSASMEAVRRLAVAAHRARPEDLPDIATQLASPLEAVALIIYLVDYEQTMLMPHTGTNVPPRDSLPIDTTLAGRVFATGRGLDAAGWSSRLTLGWMVDRSVVRDGVGEQGAGVGPATNGDEL
jgi:hypothetical protein